MACCRSCRRSARNVVLVAGGLALGAAAGWATVVALTGLGIRPPKTGAADPTSDPADARERWARVRARDGADIKPECHGELFEPTSGTPLATIVIFHGFTNCPAQFSPVAAELAARGYAVYVPRAPYHGTTDERGLPLGDLTAEKLIAHVHESVDIAAGLGRPVWALGLSTGGVLAAWAGATRHEVKSVFAIAPAAAPYKVGMPIVRIGVALRHAYRFGAYMWWDSKLKTQLSDSGGSAYPGFPARAIVPYWHLAQTLIDKRVVPNHLLDRTVVLLNPEDDAIDAQTARELVARTFTGFSSYVAEFDLPPGLGWGHDFVDQNNDHHGSPEQISSIVRAGFGVHDAPVQDGFVGAKPL
jgi:alpha-beta hydrolase superfamily lysophospholipase